MEAQENTHLALSNEIAQLSAVEAQAWKQFTENFKVQYPEPERGSAALDWEFYTAVIVAVSGIALAAFRTFQAFYNSAVTKGDEAFANFEATVSVIAVEGQHVLFAIQRARKGRKSKRKQPEQQPEQEQMDDMEERVDVRKWGMAIAIVISILAGLYQSAGILNTNTQAATDFVSGLNWMLVVAMGVGATLIAVLGGDIAGAAVLSLEKKNKLLDDELAVRRKEYDVFMQQQWLLSPEYLALQKHKRLSYRPTERTNERLVSERTGERTNDAVRSRPRTNERTPSGGDGSANERTNAKNEIFDIMDRLFIENNGQLPGQAEICRAVQFSRTGSVEGYEALKSYVNTVYKQWTPPQQQPSQ